MTYIVLHSIYLESGADMHGGEEKFLLGFVAILQYSTICAFTKYVRVHTAIHMRTVFIYPGIVHTRTWWELCSLSNTRTVVCLKSYIGLLRDPLQDHVRN